MKKSTFAIWSFVILWLTVGCSGSTQETNASVKGTIDKIQMQSESLNKKMNVDIYLPPGYVDTQRYPVLYLLHGSGGNENSWIKDMKVDKKATALIEAKTIVPLIIVMPDYDESYGTNASAQTYSRDGHDYGMYKDYLDKDLVSYVDSHYSTLATRDGRFIGGLSMGGFAALEIAFSHPELYSKVGGHSPAMFPGETASLSWLYPTEEIRAHSDPIELAKANDISSLSIYLDHADGDMDHVIATSDDLYNILKSKHANVQLHTARGQHDGRYWKSQTDSYLEFYAGV